jgi:hypothetical protein
LALKNKMEIHGTKKQPRSVAEQAATTWCLAMAMDSRGGGTGSVSVLMRVGWLMGFHVLVGIFRAKGNHAPDDMRLALHFTPTVLE